MSLINHWLKKNHISTFAYQTRSYESARQSFEQIRRLFKYMYRTFPIQTLEKLKAGFFDGPQIRKLMTNSCFQESMISFEFSAWRTFVDVAWNFIGNHRSCNYVKWVTNFIDKFQEIGANMSFKNTFYWATWTVFLRIWAPWVMNKERGSTKT